jgi:hypothetical protein
MNRKNSFLVALLTLALALSSCSGVKKQVCTVNCNVNGNANVTLTLFDAPPTGVDFITFNVPVTAVTLTPQTGGPVNVFSPSSPTIFEMTHLQSDSTLIGTFQVPTGTFTGMNIVVGSPFALFANSSTTTFPNCNPGTLCNLAGGATQIVVTFTTPLTLSSNENIGLGLEFNLANAITSTATTINIDMTKANVVKVVPLPRTGQASGTLDTIEDFVGVVKTVTGGTITLQNDAGVTFTGTTGTSTTFDVPPGGSSACGGLFNLACVAVGQTLSVDATVSIAGAVAITNVDFLDLPAVDEIEGTIFQTSTAGTFLMAVDHKILAANSTNATILAPVASGTRLNIIVGNTVAFAIDTDNLPVTPTTGFLSASDLVTGQRVMAHVKSVSVGTGGLLNVTTDRMVLRFSRFTGTPGTISGTFFGLQTPPAFLGISPATPPEVQTFVPQTLFDGVTDISGLNGITNQVSIRALFLNPFNGVQQPLLAAKVRKH